MFSSRSIMPFWLFKNAVDSLKWLCQNGNMMIMMVDHDRPLDLWMLVPSCTLHLTAKNCIKEDLISWMMLECWMQAANIGLYWVGSGEKLWYKSPSHWSLRYEVLHCSMEVATCRIESILHTCSIDGIQFSRLHIDYMISSAYWLHISTTCRLFYSFLRDDYRMAVESSHHIPS